MRVNGGADLQARALGGDLLVGDTGTSTSAPTVTTLSDTGKAWTVNGYVGHVVSIGSTYGVVLSNTATVLTIDMWHTPTAPDTVATTPASGVYVISAGQAPAWYIGISVTNTTPLIADTFLNNAGSISELWAAGGGLNRARATWAHTTAAASYTLTKQFTMAAADGSSLTLNKIGVFSAQVTAAPSAATSGPMLFETAVPSPPTLVPGDQVTFTETVSI